MIEVNRNELGIYKSGIYERYKHALKMLFSAACHSGILDLIPIAGRNAECLPKLKGSHDIIYAFIHIIKHEIVSLRYLRCKAFRRIISFFPTSNKA